MIPLHYYITLSLIMFTIGVLGVMIRRNAIVVFMSIELMLNAVNLSLVAFSQLQRNLDGQIAVFIVMVVAAAEAAVGLAIMISVFRAVRSIETTNSAQLRG
jgi:NADH-quinone oxidoreductase subunit K